MAAIPNRSSCCFIDDDDSNDANYIPYLNDLNRSSTISLSLMRSISTSSSGYASSPKRHYEVRFDHHQQRQPHFLQSCFLCRKSLAGDSDIFMYRGDTPFCSEECRMEQIEMDEARERRRNGSMKAGLQTSSNSKKAEEFSCRTGTIVAA